MEMNSFPSNFCAIFLTLIILQSYFISSRGFFQMIWLQLYLLLLQLKIMSKAVESIPSPQPKAPFDKLDLLNDIAVFFAILFVLPFMSFTVHFALFEAFSFTLQDLNGLAYIFLWYSSGILLLRGIAATVRRFKKEDIDIVTDIQAAAGASLFRVLFITSVYVFTTREWTSAQIGMSYTCQTAAWLFAAEINLISCSLIPKNKVLQSCRFFGWGVELLLIFGQMARIVSFDYFDIL